VAANSGSVATVATEREQMLHRNVDFDFIDGKWHVTFHCNFFGKKQIEVTDYLQASQEAPWGVLRSMATAMATNVGISMWVISGVSGFTIGNVTRNFQGIQGRGLWGPPGPGD
jgi:hypothetical protein